MRQARLLLLFLVPGILSLLSCGGGGGGTGPPPPPTITVTISPSSATVPTATTQQFTATVSGTSNKAVTWSVNDIAGGNATVGTISTAGLYTAPATVPSPATVTVKATSIADPTKSASATVTIVLLVVTISPPSVTLPAGGTQQFTANVAVDWTLSGAAGNTAPIGNITNDGVYTAPPAPPLSGQVTVTAAAQVDPTKTASAAVTIVFSNATLQGHYAFSFRGFDINGPGFIAGSFVADGNGNMTGGVWDIHTTSGAGANISFAGTYTIGADGRGYATLNTGGPLPLDLRFVMLSSDAGLLIQFDTWATGAGNLDKQDPSAFSAELSGDYVFHLDGLSNTGSPPVFNPLAVAGMFSASGGVISSGLEDINDNGIASASVSFTGTYSAVDTATGRGTAALTNAQAWSQFSFYVLGTGSIIFVSLDPSPGYLGEAVSQGAPPFSNGSLSGDFVFATTGYIVSPLGPLFAAGRFTADGAGNMLNGIEDVNANGSVTMNTPFITGTYSVAPTGRGTALITTAGGTSDLVLYMASPQLAYFVGIETTKVSTGQIQSQVGSPFSTTDVSGHFGLGLRGTATSVSRDISGQFVATGSTGNIPSGTWDVNDLQILHSDQAFTGSYSVSPYGRGTLTIAPCDYMCTSAMYLISPSRIILVGIDPPGVPMLGYAGKQL